MFWKSLYSVFNLLSFVIFTCHSLPSQSWWNRLHLEENSVIFFLCLNDALLSCWSHRMSRLSEWSLSCWLRCGMSDIRFYFFKFNKEFDIALIDLQIFVIKFIGKCFTFCTFNLLHLNISGVIELELSLSILSDLSKFLEMVFVGPW